MTNKVRPIPEGFHTATPYLIVRDAAAAIEFYKKAFGATELMRQTDPNERIRHAEIRIGSSPIMIGGHTEIGAPSPQSLPRVSIYLYVEDVDALASRAIAAGAKELYPVKDQAYGNREGGIEDPFGITWWIATHTKDMSPEETEQPAA